MFFGQDRQNFDNVFCYVIEHANVIDPESILRFPHAPQTLDATATNFCRFMSQMNLHGSHNGRAVFRLECAKIICG